MKNVFILKWTNTILYRVLLIYLHFIDIDDIDILIGTVVRKQE